LFPESFFFFLAGAALVTAFYRFWQSPERLIKRTLAATPTTRVADVRDGAGVKIAGVVAPAQAPLITSPLTGRSCFYYCIVVQERRNGQLWTPILREERGVDFQVRDDSGAALVRPDRAKTVLIADETREQSLLTMDDERLERFMRERGRSTRGILLQKTLRADEAILVAGQRIAVAALARWEVDADGDAVNYREPARRLTLAATGQVPLLISDYPVAFGRR
jgi:hypothetical protein